MSVACKAKPTVAAKVSLPGIGISYQIYILSAIAAPKGRTAILNAVAMAERLHTIIVEPTASVDAGTVYSVVKLAAAGADCPSGFICVGI